MPSCISVIFTMVVRLVFILFIALIFNMYIKLTCIIGVFINFFIHIFIIFSVLFLEFIISSRFVVFFLWPLYCFGLFLLISYMFLVCFLLIAGPTDKGQLAACSQSGLFFRFYMCPLSRNHVTIFNYKNNILLYIFIIWWVIEPQKNTC